MGDSENPPVLPASVLAALHPQLTDGASVDDLLRHVCARAIEVFAGADAASVTMCTQGQSRTFGATAALALAADEEQYKAGSGPCLQAAQTNQVVHVSDLSTDTRWVAAAAMAVLGARSSLSLPLPIRDESIGSLNVYARRPHAFDDATLLRTADLAAHAGVAVSNAVSFITLAEQGRQLREAMESRAVIEQAKGILIATTGCNADAAFKLLVQQSQHENRKLRDIAIEMVTRKTRVSQI